jgi:hypothetical protein
LIIILLFLLKKSQKLDRLPCASLLVRILKAPMTEDGLRALTLDEVAQKDWEKKKIWPRPPPYGTKSYNTKLCPLKDSEKDLFMFRIKKDGEEEKT